MAFPSLKIPEPPANLPPELRAWASELVRVLQIALDPRNFLSGDRYSVSNNTVTRSLNVTSAATLDVAKVLGTLIDDLRNNGIVS